MSAFEFVFTFYAILLGLALSNVAVGFGRLWRLKSRVVVGWLTPLLAIYMIEMVIDLWAGAWLHLHDRETVDTLLLGLMLTTALPLIFASVVLLPDSAETEDSLDDHYLAHRRAILGSLSLSCVALLVGAAVVQTVSPERLVRSVMFYLPLIAGPVVLMFSARKWLHVAILSALILYHGWLLS